MLKMTKYFLFIILLMFTVLETSAQTKCPAGISVTVTKSYTNPETSPEEGKRKTLELARAEAIAQAAGIKVVAETYYNKSETTKGSSSEDYFESFSNLSRSTASGRIVDESVNYTTGLSADGTPIYTAVLNACVVKDSSSADPSFIVEFKLDKSVYLDKGSTDENDALNFSVSSSKHCFIYLFNILANDSVQLLIPNKYVPTAEYNPAKKEQDFQRILRELNAKFTVQLPAGKNRSKEALYLVALKDNVNFPFAKHNGFYLSASAAYKDIMQWMTTIPPERRTEAFQSYEIIKH